MNFIDNVEILARSKGYTTSSLCEELKINEVQLTSYPINDLVLGKLADFFNVSKKSLMDSPKTSFVLFKSKTESLKNDYKKAYKNTYSSLMVFVPLLLIVGLVFLLINEIIQNKDLGRFSFLTIFYILVTSAVALVLFTYPLFKKYINYSNNEEYIDIYFYCDRVTFLGKESKTFSYSLYSTLGETFDSFYLINQKGNIIVMSKEGLTGDDVNNLRSIIQSSIKNYEWYGKIDISYFSNEIDEKNAKDSIGKRNIYLTLWIFCLSIVDYILLGSMLLPNYFDNNYLISFAMAGFLVLVINGGLMGYIVYCLIKNKYDKRINYLFLVLNILFFIAVIIICIITYVKL